MNAPFGASTTAQQREAQRQERERERLEKERIEREEQNQLTEEQREEIREAVCLEIGVSSLMFEWQIYIWSCVFSFFAKQRPDPEVSHMLEHDTDFSGMLIQFTLFDLDKDQKIDYHEFKVALKALGFDLPKPEVLQLLQTHGAPSSPSPPHQIAASSAKDTAGGLPHTSRLLLSFSAFQTIMTQKILARDPREEIMRAFDLFDEGAKGKISLNDLRRVARELGEGLEEEELVAMIEEFDLDGDGAIDREEFLGICLQ